jgi:hypothetical protein
VLAKNLTFLGHDKNCYYHDCFLRDNWEIADKIKRTAVKGTGRIVSKPSVLQHCNQQAPSNPPAHSEGTKDGLSPVTCNQSWTSPERNAYGRNLQEHHNGSQSVFNRINYGSLDEIGQSNSLNSATTQILNQIACMHSHHFNYQDAHTERNCHIQSRLTPLFDQMPQKEHFGLLNAVIGKSFPTYSSVQQGYKPVQPSPNQRTQLLFPEIQTYIHQLKQQQQHKNYMAIHSLLNSLALHSLRH